MSDTTTVVVLDPDEIDKFKQRFAVARSKDIAAAYTDAIDKSDKADLQRKKVDTLTTAAGVIKTKWDQATKTRASKKGKGSETPNSTELQCAIDHGAAVEKVNTAQKTLDGLEKQRDLALKTAELLPREAYKEKGAELAARLKGTGTTLPEVAPDAVKAMKGCLDTRDYDAADKNVAAMKAAVLETVAARDVPVRLKDLSARLDTLSAQKFKDSKTLKSLGATLEDAKTAKVDGELLGRLEDEFTPELARFEEMARDFIARRELMSNEIGKLERGGGDVGALTLELGKCVNLAALQLGKAAPRLADLAMLVRKAQDDFALQNSNAIDYPPLLQQIRDRIKNFGAISDTHKAHANQLKAASKTVAQAEGEALKKDFTGALQLLHYADGEIDVVEEKADVADKSRSDKEKAAAKQKLLAAQQKAQQAAQLQAAIDLQQRKDALTVESLDLIGRDADYATWIDKVRQLWDADTVTLTVGGDYWLPGNNTVELPVTVKADPDFADDFVVHYHPFPNGYGSECHSKPWSGNLQTPKDYMSDTSHWLFGASVPSLAKIKGDYGA